MLETGSESTAQKLPRGRQEQFETGEKRWLDNLVLKQNYDQYLPYSGEAPAAKPVDVWARVGVSTRWLVTMKDAGYGGHGHSGGNSFLCHEQLFLYGLRLDL